MPDLVRSGHPDQVRGKLWAVVPAAGRGTRFGANVPKQYLQAGGQPLIAWALQALLAHPSVVGAMPTGPAGTRSPASRCRPVSGAPSVRIRCSRA
jgi:CTP:molybdopterin cytidylyltransferase MocA